MNIVIAEDDPVSRLLLQRTTEKFGHRCLVATDGAEAWALFRATPGVDVVISDWMMPNMNGLELCRLVRRASHDDYAYFIFLTALGDREHLLAGIEAGADDYLTKPLDREELQVRLISAARVTSLHRRLADQNRRLESLTGQLHDQSRKDELTGLGNRLQLREQLELVHAAARRYGHTYCVVMCDVDDFKTYNDDYGHQAGDHVLREVGTAIAGHCRASDIACRYGGEEFLIILPHQSLEGGKGFAERVRRSIEGMQIVHEGSRPRGVVTISAGVAAYQPDTNADELVNDADAALYNAKEAGRNRVVAHSAAGEPEAVTSQQ